MPPSSATPTSNETRVRVEGFSNTSATLLPASAIGPLAARPPRLQLERAVEQRAQLVARELLAGEEVAGHGKRRMVRRRPPRYFGVEIGAITWNLFHGRDFPPDPALHTWRSRLRRTTERNATHVQVNRELVRGVRRRSSAPRGGTSRCSRSARRAGPPRWPPPAGPTPSARSPHATGLAPSAAPRPAGTPTCSAPGRAARTSPWSEGRIAGGLLDRRELVLRRRPERRTMAFARLGSGLCVANLHASTSPASRGGGRAPRCRGGRRLGRRVAADPRRRLQPAAEPDRGCSRSWRGDSASAPRPAPTPSTTSSAEGSRSSTRRPPGRPRRGSCPARASDCASPTMPRSRRDSRPEDG